MCTKASSVAKLAAILSSVKAVISEWIFFCRKKVNNMQYELTRLFRAVPQVTYVSKHPPNLSVITSGVLSPDRYSNLALHNVVLQVLSFQYFGNKCNSLIFLVCDSHYFDCRIFIIL